MRNVSLKTALYSALLAAVLAGALPTHATAQTIQLTFSDLFPAQYPFGKLTQAWSDEVKARTGGKVEVKVFPSGTLTPPPQCFEGAVTGLSDICQTVLAYTPGRFPVMAAVDLPGYPDTGQVTTRVAYDLYQHFKPKEFDQVSVLYLHAHPPGQILTTSKPVRNLDDLKGLRIRSTGLSAKIATALGASPVSMPITQAYDPLKRGVVDGTDGTFNTLKYYRFAEVTKYVTVSTPVGYVSAFAIVMNKKKWESLPDDVKKVLNEMGREYVEKTASLWDQIEIEGYKEAKAKGVAFISLPPQEIERWKEAVLPKLRKEYVEEANRQGLPGEQIVSYRDSLVAKYAQQYKPLPISTD